MLDFSFTEEQNMFRRMLREFALRELLPNYGHWDRLPEYPKEEIKKICQLVVTDLPPEEHTVIHAGIIAEEIARGDFNCVLPSMGPSVWREFVKDASPQLEEMWYPSLIRGEKMIGLAITEPEAGSDVGQMSTRARRDGDDYVLNGEKNSVSYLHSDVFYIFARTGPEPSGWKGISAFLVPRETPGLSFNYYDDMGCRAVPRGQLFMDDVRVPAWYMVGQEGQAFKAIMSFFDVNRAFIGLKCLGATEQTLDETIEYAKKRKQFGVPIAAFQGVSFPIAEAVTLVEAARLLCYKILWLRHNNQPCALEGAMAKWWVPQISAEIIHQCLLIHGHYGYNKELPIEQRLRDVIGWQIGDGTPQIQKVLISRILFGRDVIGSL
jgi:cyclohexanecarboxyl-CoA dehydrogenase